jgi:hypothetical protein
MSEPKNPEAPAYPFACQGPTTAPEIYYGLTKRELFAAMAMQGVPPGYFESLERTAEYAVERADALIAELEKKQ